MTDLDQLAAESLAQRFHETYERLAPSFGYETREASAKPWAEVPEQNRALMVAVCAELTGAVERATRPLLTVPATGLRGACPRCGVWETEGCGEGPAIAGECPRMPAPSGRAVQIPARCPTCGVQPYGLAMDSPRRPDSPPPKLIPCWHLAPPAPPRAWSMPTIPEDVQAVRGADGMIWYRHRHGPGWWNEDGDRLPTAQLLAAGKVTEILPAEFEEPEVLEDNRG